MNVYTDKGMSSPMTHESKRVEESGVERAVVIGESSTPSQIRFFCATILRRWPVITDGPIVGKLHSGGRHIAGSPEVPRHGCACTARECRRSISQHAARPIWLSWFVPLCARTDTTPGGVCYDNHGVRLSPITRPVVSSGHVRSASRCIGTI